MRRILVTGVEDFVGARLVGALSRAGGWTPVAAVRRPGPPRADGVEQLQLDPGDEAGIAKALRGVEAVANCRIGMDAANPAYASAMYAAAAKAQRPPRIIQLSTFSVYGNSTGLLDETAPLPADETGYVGGRIASERVAAAYPRAVILRPGITYGPGSAMWSVRVARWLLARRLGDLGVAGDGLCNLVHVDDVVAAILRALDNPALDGRTYNLAGPQPPTWNEYFVGYGRALRAVPVRRVTGRRLRIETRLLAPPLKILEIAATRAKLPLRLPPPIPPSFLALARQEIRLAVVRAQKELGMTWKPLDDGLRETAAAVLAELQPGKRPEAAR